MGLFASGCAIHPLPDDISRKSTVDIVQAIRCEAGREIEDNDPNLIFDSAVIGLAFTFDITEKNGATADFTLTRGFAGGAVGIGLSGGAASLTREAKRTFTITDTFKDLRALQCGSKSPAVSAFYPVTGTIGVGEVISTFMRIEKLKTTGFKEGFEGKEKIDASTIAFADELTFKTMFTAPGIKHSMAFDTIPGVLRVTAANTGTSADRLDEHRLTVALALPTLTSGTEPGNKKAATEKSRSRTEFKLLSNYGFTGSRVPSKPQIDATIEARAKVLYTLERKRLLGIDENLALALRGR